MYENQEYYGTSLSFLRPLRRRDNMRTFINFMIIAFLSACTPRLVPVLAITPSVTQPSPFTPQEDLPQISPTSTPTFKPTILGEIIVSTPDEGHLKRLVDAAKKDLAQRLEILPDEIKMLHIENAEWPDTILGCAKPGLALRFVAVPGYRIILSANGRNYVYHTDRENGAVYCPKDKGK
jgi:hypothetical protein